jgi:hypothetical protein
VTRLLTLAFLLWAVIPAAAEQTNQAQPPIGQNSTSATLGVFVYPKHKQDASQQQKDENECYGWAKQQTAIDPAAIQSQQTPEAEKKQGGGAKGAAGGAAGGAALGAIAGDAGKGAAMGATVGTVRGRRQQKKANKEAEKQAQTQASAQQQESLNKFKNAFSSCIDARGYSVK